MCIYSIIDFVRRSFCNNVYDDQFLFGKNVILRVIEDGSGHLFFVKIPMTNKHRINCLLGPSVVLKHCTFYKEIVCFFDSIGHSFFVKIMLTNENLGT